MTDSSVLGGDTRAELLTLSHLDQSYHVLVFGPLAGEASEAFSRITRFDYRPTDFGTDSGPAVWQRVRSAAALVTAVGKVAATSVRCRPDVIFVGDRPRAALVGRFAALVSRAPLVYHPQFFYFRAGFSSRVRRRVARAAHLVICHSEHSKSSYERAGVLPMRVRVAPNPVDVSSYSPGDRLEARTRLGLRADDFIIGNTSHMRLFKGQDVLIEAVGTVCGRLPRLRLLLAGDGVTMPDLVKLVEKLGLQREVVFHGHTDELLTVYRALDVFVMPSLEEPFGLVTIEAMACGLPVIGTRSGGTPEIVVDGETGVLVAPGSAEEMARAIVEIEASADRRVEMGEAGHRRATSHYTVERRASIVSGLLSDLVGAERGLK